MNAQSTANPRLPTLYIAHGGGPCFFMEWSPPDTWTKMADWLRAIPSTLNQRPKAILVASGHWEEPRLSVTAASQPPLIYDYYGFPPHTYELRYDAPGSPQLADRVCELLKASGFDCSHDPQRGFDHGVFIPFKLIYPDADIPIVQISLLEGLDPAAHLAIGRALEPLRDEGVLIVGSGMSFHNLRAFGTDMRDISGRFDRWLTDTVTSADIQQRNERLTHWENAPFARIAHPREEHLIPLLVAAGAAGPDQGRRIFNDTVMGTVVSAYQFG